MEKVNFQTLLKPFWSLAEKSDQEKPYNRSDYSQSRSAVEAEAQTHAYAKGSGYLNQDNFRDINEFAKSRLLACDHLNPNFKIYFDGEEITLSHLNASEIYQTITTKLIEKAHSLLETNYVKPSKSARHRMQVTENRHNSDKTFTRYSGELKAKKKGIGPQYHTSNTKALLAKYTKSNEPMEIYLGEFKAGKYNGSGILFKNGDLTIAEFKKGKPNDNFLMINSEGEVFSQNYHCGGDDEKYVFAQTKQGTYLGTVIKDQKNHGLFRSQFGVMEKYQDSQLIKLINSKGVTEEAQCFDLESGFINGQGNKKYPGKVKILGNWDKGIASGNFEFQFPRQKLMVVIPSNFKVGDPLNFSCNYKDYEYQGQLKLVALSNADYYKTHYLDDLLVNRKIVPVGQGFLRSKQSDDYIKLDWQSGALQKATLIRPNAEMRNFFKDFDLPDLIERSIELNGEQQEALDLRTIHLLSVIDFGKYFFNKVDRPDFCPEENKQLYLAEKKKLLKTAGFIEGFYQEMDPLKDLAQKRQLKLDVPTYKKLGMPVQDSQLPKMSYETYTSILRDPKTQKDAIGRSYLLAFKKNTTEQIDLSSKARLDNVVLLRDLEFAESKHYSRQVFFGQVRLKRPDGHGIVVAQEGEKSEVYHIMKSSWSDGEASVKNYQLIDKEGVVSESKSKTYKEFYESGNWLVIKHNYNRGLMTSYEPNGALMKVPVKMLVRKTLDFELDGVVDMLFPADSIFANIKADYFEYSYVDEAIATLSNGQKIRCYFDNCDGIPDLSKGVSLLTPILGTDGFKEEEIDLQGQAEKITSDYNDEDTCIGITDLFMQLAALLKSEQLLR